VETKETGDAPSATDKEGGKLAKKKKKKKKGSTVLRQKKMLAVAGVGAKAGADAEAAGAKDLAKVKKKSRKSTLRKKKSTSIAFADAQAGGASPGASSPGASSPGKQRKSSSRASKISKRGAKTTMQRPAASEGSAGSVSSTPRSPKKRVKKRTSTMKLASEADAAEQSPPAAAAAKKKKKKKKLRSKTLGAAAKRPSASADGTGAAGSNSNAAGEAPPPLRRRKGSRKSSKLAPPKSAVVIGAGSPQNESAASRNTRVAVVEEEGEEEPKVVAAAADALRVADAASTAASSPALGAPVAASAATSNARGAARGAESKPALGDIASLLLPSRSTAMDWTPRARAGSGSSEKREASVASFAADAATRAAVIAALVPPTVPFDGSGTEDDAAEGADEEEGTVCSKEGAQRVVQPHAVAERVADLEAGGAALSTPPRLPARVAPVVDSRESNARAMAALTQAAHPGWPGRAAQSAPAAPAFVPPAFAVLARRTSPIRRLRPDGARGGGGRSAAGVGGRTCEFAALCVLLDDAVSAGAARCARLGVRASPVNNAISSVDFERCIARSFRARDAAGSAVAGAALSRADGADGAALRKLGSAIFALFDSGDSGFVDAEILKPFLSVVLTPTTKAPSNAQASSPAGAPGALVVAPGGSPLARAGTAVAEIASALLAADGGDAGALEWSGGDARQREREHRFAESGALADGGQWDMAGVDNRGDEWVCVRTAASGMLPYWYNRRTNASSWTPPLELVEEAAARSCGMLGEHSAWTRLHDPETNTPYWFNRVTCVSQWSPPPPTVRALSPEKLQRWADGARRRVERRELRALKDDARRSAHVALRARAAASHNRPPGLSLSLGRARAGGAPGHGAPSTHASPRLRLPPRGESAPRAAGAVASSYERVQDDASAPRRTASPPLSIRGTSPRDVPSEFAPAASPDRGSERWARAAAPQRERRNARVAQLRAARIERREADRETRERRAVHPGSSATREGGASPSRRRRPRGEAAPLNDGSGSAPQLSDLDSIWAEFDAHLDRLSDAGMSTSRWEERPTLRRGGAPAGGSRSPARGSAGEDARATPQWSGAPSERVPIGNALRTGVSPVAPRDDVGGARFRAQSEPRRQGGFEVGATSLAMSAVSRSLQRAAPQGATSPSASTFRPIAGWPKRIAR
jgi:hypothetical protein